MELGSVCNIRLCLLIVDKHSLADKKQQPGLSEPSAPNLTEVQMPCT